MSGDPDRPSPAVKFARRTNSGRVMSMSRDDDLDILDTQNDYSNKYTVMMPATPDNMPGDPAAAAASADKPDGPTRFRTEPQRRGGRQGGEGDGGKKTDRRMSSAMNNSNNNKSMLLRSQTQDFDHNHWLFETKGKYGIGNAYWEEDDSFDNETGMSMQDFMDKPWKPLTRKINVPPEVISPYR